MEVRSEREMMWKKEKKTVKKFLSAQEKFFHAHEQDKWRKKEWEREREGEEK